MAYHTEPGKTWDLESPANGDDIQGELERLYETIAFLKTEIEGDAHLPAPPVGAIIAWHKDLTGVPALPAGWMECDGSVISDAESPMNGESVPDLNGQDRFLRGNVTSGISQDDAFQDHGHNQVGPGNHTVVFAVRNDGTSLGGIGGGTDMGWDYYVTVVGANEDVGSGIPRTDTETRPINMSVVWIIRIK